MLPKEGELWVVNNSDTKHHLIRTVLIYRKNKQDLTEVLLCNSDLSLATSTTLIVGEPNLSLKYSIGINVDLLANIYDSDSQFVRKIGEVTKDTYNAIKNIIDGPDSKKADFLEKGEKLIFKSDRRWISKKNEILVSHLLSKNAHYVGELFANIDEVLISNTDPELGYIIENLPHKVSFEETVVQIDKNLYKIEKHEKIAIAMGI